MPATLEQVLRAGQARRGVATGTPAEDDQIAFMAALRETNELLRSENAALKEENEELRRQNDAMRRVRIDTDDGTREARLEACREEFRRLWAHKLRAQREYNENYERWTEAERERARDRVIDIQRRTWVQKQICEQIKNEQRNENHELGLMRQLREEQILQEMSDRAYAVQLAEAEHHNF